MGATSIEWADLTFNPWHGCEKVSPACAHCYAEGQSNRFNGAGMWGAGHGFRFQSDAYWSKPLQWARTWPAKLGRRPRVFCASMADVFEERPELDEHRERLFDLIEATPELDWLLLTKRPEFAHDWLYAHEPYMVTTPLPFITRDDLPWGLPANIWLGVSIENARFTWRADVLREIPAAVRFISAEPLLGSLYDRRPNDDLASDQKRPARDGALVAATGGVASTEALADRTSARAPLDLTGIDWVIAGGESGPKARPSHPDWFREIRDACVGYGQTTCPAFFFKQWGEWAPWGEPRTSEQSFGGMTVAIESEAMCRIGKRAAGRKLDGRVWDEFPASVAVPA